MVRIICRINKEKKYFKNITGIRNDEHPMTSGMSLIMAPEQMWSIVRTAHVSFLTTVICLPLVLLHSYVSGQQEEIIVTLLMEAR